MAGRALRVAVTFATQEAQVMPEMATWTFLVSDVVELAEQVVPLVAQQQSVSVEEVVEEMVETRTRTPVSPGSTGTGLQTHEAVGHPQR